jgi:hypothetical protein
MTPHSVRKPRNWQDFERNMRLLLQCVFGDPGTIMNGRQGQPQHGVDIYGRLGGSKWFGVQCKQRLNVHVTPTELREEVAKARRFEPYISYFVLATSASRDGKIQREARRLTEANRRARRPMSVHVWGWEDIEDRAADYADALKAFDPHYSPFIEQAERRIQRTIGEASKRLERQIALLAPRHFRHNAHDDQLFRRFRTIATPERLAYLWQHDFRGGARSSFLELFEQMSEEWFGADYEFIDSRVQAAFEPVMARIAKFADLTLNNLYVIDESPWLRTAKTDEDIRNRIRSSSTREATKAMNEAAIELWKAIDSFFRVARKTLIL